MSGKRKVSAVVVNWNGREFLPACLDSIFKQSYKNMETIVVDCASQDESVEFTRRHFPLTKVVELKEDNGPPYAINLAARRAEGEYVLILNNDVILPPDLIEKMVDELEKEENCVINPVELTFNGDYTGAGCSDSGVGRRLHRFLKVKGVGPFFPSTACCLTTRNLLLQNPLNENLFMYEDTEWGWRLVLKAIKLKVLTNTFFLHNGAGTNGSYSPKQSFFLGRLAMGNYWICFRLTTFMLLFPFIFYNIIIQSLGLVKRKRWDSLKSYGKGLISFLKNLRSFNDDRKRVSRERIKNDWEVLKIMAGAFDFNKEIRREWNRQSFLRGKHFAENFGTRS